MSQKQFVGAYIIFGLVIFLMQVFPFYSIGNRALPIVLGMPFSMFWIVMWIFLQFVGLMGFYHLYQKLNQNKRGMQ